MEQAEQELQIALSMLSVLTAMGLNVEDPSLRETPTRVAKFLVEFCQYRGREGLEAELATQFGEDEDGSTDNYKNMVIQQDIPFAALCEHHLLPFYGTVDIGYIPRGRIVGLSKLTRLVRAAGRQYPTVQERITDQIVEALYKGLRCQGAIVVVRAEHTCMSVRGVQAPGVVTTTSAIRGLFRDAPATRQEFFDLLRR